MSSSFFWHSAARRVDDGDLGRAAMGADSQCRPFAGHFPAACALTSRIVAHGNLSVAREQFFIDASRVFW